MDAALLGLPVIIGSGDDGPEPLAVGDVLCVRQRLIAKQQDGVSVKRGFDFAPCLVGQRIPQIHAGDLSEERWVFAGNLDGHQRLSQGQLISSINLAHSSRTGRVSFADIGAMLRTIRSTPAST